MHADAFDLFNAPEPFADAGWCGVCAVCAALRRRPSLVCGCPVGRRGTGTHRSTGLFEAPVSVRRSGAGPATPSCLHAAGRRLAHSLYHGADLRDLPALKATHVLTEAVAVHNRSQRSEPASSGSDLSTAGLTHHQALVLFSSHLQHLVATGDLAQRTVTKTVANVASLGEFMTSGVNRPFVADTTSADVARWVEAPLGGRRRNGQQAAATTRRLRRSSARLYFRVLRNLGMFASDPTIDIPAHPGVAGTTLPLTDTELLQLRYACTTLDEAARLPSCLAIAEATGTTGEMARSVMGDIDLRRSRIWLRGDSRRRERWVPLSSWGVRKLSARIDYLRSRGANASTLVVYSGSYDSSSSESPGASTAEAMGELLKRAGLAGEPGIKPASIGLSFALRVWNERKDIRYVASALGYQSLDKAATAIGVDPLADLDKDQAIDDVLRSSVLADVAVKHQLGKRRRGHRR